MRLPGRSRGFTLLELLVVISIIAILIGLLLPVVWHSQKKAKVTRAKREVKELEEAWKAFCLEYKCFPPNIMMMDANAVTILRGVDLSVTTNLNPYNFRNIPFLDFRTNTIYYCDPWGVPNTTKGVYNVRLDEDLDGKVLVGADSIGVSVAVWSFGPDGITFTEDDVCSWKE